MKKKVIKDKLNKLQLSDIYSLMLFIMYSVEDIPELATEYLILSKLCFLLDGNNLTRLLAHYAGQTITIPSERHFRILTNALLMYQYINLEGQSLVYAQRQLNVTDDAEKEEILNLYLKIIPIINNYDIDVDQVRNGKK